jgi:hypothetical protein
MISKKSSCSLACPSRTYEATLTCTILHYQMGNLTAANSLVFQTLYQYIRPFLCHHVHTRLSVQLNLPTRALYLGVKRLQCKADNSPLSIVEVKTVLSFLYLLSHIVSRHIQNFTLNLHTIIAWHFIKGELHFHCPWLLFTVYFYATATEMLPVSIRCDQVWPDYYNCWGDLTDCCSVLPSLSHRGVSVAAGILIPPSFLFPDY